MAERDCIWEQPTIGWFEQQARQEPLSRYRLALWGIQFGRAAHQTASDLHATNPICLQAFVRTITPGLHTVIPIQFAPSVPRAPNAAEHKVTLLGGH